MTGVSKILLQIAENPLDYVEHAQDAETAKIPGHEGIVAANLARQASASVVSNCVVELWSASVCYLHALEPDFPLYPSSVVKFVKDTRLPFLSYVSLYFSICGEPFEGTAICQKARTIVDMRHELQHDKPEESNDYSTERIDKILKWQKRLIPLVGHESLAWLPRIRRSADTKGFNIGGEPTIMKFMKYPVAKWAFDTTQEIIQEMSDMLFRYQGRRKIRKESTADELVASVDNRLSPDEDLELWRLWLAGE
jgi:hypothetical protein